MKGQPSFWAYAFDIATGHTARKALQLYKQCRYQEARQLILEILDLYTYRCRSSVEILGRVAEAVSRRLNALCLIMLGDVESALGKKAQAEDCYTKALPLAQELGELHTLAKACHAMGTLFWNLGNYEDGLEFCHLALELLDGKKDRLRTRNKTLTTLTLLYKEIGQLNTAVKYAREEVECAVKQKDKAVMSASLANLASTYMEYGDVDQAIAILGGALEKASTQDVFQVQQQALILNNLGMCYLRRNLPHADLETAAHYFSESISLSRQIGHLSMEAVAIGNRGKVFQFLGENDSALEALEQSLEVCRKVGSKSDLAIALTNLARHLSDHHHGISGACKACAEAIGPLESMRGGLSREFHRITFSETQIEPYELVVDLLMRSGQPEDALEYIERSKSKALMEFLAGKLNSAMGSETDSEGYCTTLQLLDEIDELRRILEALYAVDLPNEEEKTRTAKWSDRDYADHLTQEHSRKETDFEEAFDNLVCLNPDLASLISMMPLAMPDFQSVLDDGTVLLELYQTEERLHVLLVANSGIVRVHQVHIPFLETADDVHKFREALSQQAPLDIRSHEFFRNIKEPLAFLYEKIVRPLVDWLKPYHRILLLPNLLWHYFPFHALYDRRERLYLCDQFEIGYAPSASVLNLCHKKKRLGRDSGFLLSRNSGALLHAEKEVELLAAAFHPNARVSKGEEAHLELAKDVGIPLDVVHLACHAFFDSERPCLSAIDIPPDESAARKTYLQDLFNLRLNCSLVTLSSCESALSFITSADELIGWSRALFHAGTAAVMLSLWRVADEATAYLMQNFYWHFVKNRQTKTRALQLAMQAVKAQKNLAHPY